MNPARFALAAVVATMLIAGCTGTAAPTASPTELAAATPSPTIEPTAAPTATPNASPAAGPTLIPYPGPSIPPGTLTLQIAAKNLAFDTANLAAPANAPFVIHFANNDTCATAPCPAHNVAIKLGADFLFNPLPAITAPAQADYFINGGLAAGTYTFLCTVHPVMHGTLTIQ
jgi:plastocyanin